MKKSLFLAACAVSILAMTSVQAIEVKKPDVSALKNVSSVAKGAASATSATQKTDTSAKDAAFQKQFQATIDSSKKQLEIADKMANDAIWTLGEFVLDKETYDGFKSAKAEAGTFDTLLKSMNAKLKTQLKTGDIDAYSFENNKAAENKYVAAVKDLQVAQNRRANIINNMSPTFKKILEGEVSMLNVKAQLAESTKLSKDIKSASMGQQPLLNKLDKINVKQKIKVEIPENEKVKYNKDGIVGSINYQLDTTNANVDKAYDSLIAAFDLKKEVNSILADMNNNEDSTSGEKGNLREAKVKALNDKAKERETKQKAGEEVAALTVAQQKAIEDASAKLTEALASYTSLGISCTKLGLQISSKPILAAPLALEVDQLKYTAKMLKSGASSIKNTLVVIKSLK